MRWLLLIAAMLLSAAPLRAQTGPVTVHIPASDGAILNATLIRPDWAVKAPALVALHGCGGPFPRRDAQWAQALAADGHIVLFPDSFGSRGLGSQCQVKSRIISPTGQRRRDALAAAAWLAAQPGTPPGGVALIGWSNGASTVLAAGRAAPDVPAGLIRGLLAFYPGCRPAAKNPGWAPVAPLLVMIGESDDWTPAAPCRDLAARFPGRITLVTYPGAWHEFDVADWPVRVRHGLAYTAGGDGVAHVGGDPAARQDALTRVPAFLAALPPIATPAQANR
ncbi:MAG: dienelactone hydrolase family protein [Acidisphaera sp.]|nr:dienelactone hydrolase family protein [Acidisphaera sp.]